MGILVDRERKGATCAITKVPMLAHPILDSLITPGLSIKSVAGTQATHDRILPEIMQELMLSSVLEFE